VAGEKAAVALTVAVELLVAQVASMVLASLRLQLLVDREAFHLGTTQAKEVHPATTVAAVQED
jgi:hypothetical protein